MNVKRRSGAVVGLISSSGTNEPEQHPQSLVKTGTQLVQRRMPLHINQGLFYPSRLDVCMDMV